MDISEVKRILDEQGRAFEEFKKANEARLAEIATKGYAREDLEAKLTTINEALNNAHDELTRLHKQQQKLELGGGAKGDALTEEQRQYKTAFVQYMRKGNNTSVLEDLHRKAMSVDSDPDGGYWVSPDVGGRIVSKIFETSPVRQRASVVTISTDAIEGVNDRDEASCGWVAERGARTETNTPQTGKYRIDVHEMYAMPKITQKLLDDAAVDVEGWLQAKVSDKFSRTENAAFITGDGVGKPRGLLDYPTAATADATRAFGTLEHLATGTSGGFGTDPNGSDKLVTLVHKLKSAYRAGATWTMNRVTLGEVRKLKDTNGSYIWLPSMMAGQPSSLLGYPVDEFEDMPAIGANSLSIAFGNWSAYQIVDRLGIRVLRDPFTEKGHVLFYTTRRVGGALLDSEAIKLMKFGTS